MPSARDLRQKVTFQRRQPLPDGDGAGNFEGDFVDLFSRFAKLTPTTSRAGEAVIAGRLQGTAIYDLWLRSDSGARSVTLEDRVFDAGAPERLFNVRWIGDLDGRGQWLLMQLEIGSAT